MTTTTPPLIIDSRYQVRNPLGQGSFGVVYEVLDLHLDEVCALKLLNRTPFGDWTEAQILRQVHGEHILPILNADLASGHPYVVTDLAIHGTVATQITPDIGVPIALAVQWARQACQGVARLHDHKLLHCDIKPENLFLNDRQDALVGDLGLAQLQDHNGLAVACGSMPTMAPEVARVGVSGQYVPSNRTYGVRSDVYSLGATLFWMLSGAQPVPGVVSHADVWNAPQPDLWMVAPHVPQGLRDTVNKAIARDPADRFASPADLDAALGGRTLQVREWARVVPHIGHEQCFFGDMKGASQLQVCAISKGGSPQNQIVVSHVGTGRALKKASRTARRAGLAVALRSAFRACG